LADVLDPLGGESVGVPPARIFGPLRIVVQLEVALVRPDGLDQEGQGLAAPRLRGTRTVASASTRSMIAFADIVRL